MNTNRRQLRAIGHRVRSALSKANITQKELAKIMDVSPTAVQNWVHGRAAMDILILIEISRLTHISPDWLLGWQPEDRKNVRDAIVAAVEAALMFRNSKL